MTVPSPNQSEATASKDTATRIIDALVDVILDGGLPGFSVQEVADRAGVSHRTVYRHFPTREALLDGLSDAVIERMEVRGSVNDLDTLDDLPTAARINFDLFSRDRRAIEAAVRFEVGAAIESADRQGRTKMFQAVAYDALPEPSPRDAAIAGAVLRQLVSSRSWLGLTVEAGLDAEDAAEGVAWAAAVIVDALRAGRTPSREPRRPLPVEGEPDGSSGPTGG